MFWSEAYLALASILCACMVNKNDDQGRNNRLFLQAVILRLAGNPSQTTQSKDIILIVMMQIVIRLIDDRDADNCHCSMFSCSVFLVNVCYNTIRDKQPWFRHKKMKKKKS